MMTFKCQTHLIALFTRKIYELLTDILVKLFHSITPILLVKKRNHKSNATKKYVSTLIIQTKVFGRTVKLP